MAAVPLTVTVSTRIGVVLRWWVVPKHALRALLLACVIIAAPATTVAFEERALESVVSVIPLWPGHLRGAVPPKERQSPSCRAACWRPPCMSLIGRRR
jgi:hypothetical protein